VSSSRALARVLLALVVLAGCGAPPHGASCRTDGECSSGLRCVDGECAPPDDAGEACGPGETARGGTCTSDCGDPSSLPCASGQVCNYATGLCASEGSEGVLSGDPQSCGSGLCYPGTECALDGRCEPAPPCYAMACDDAGTTCWGRSCSTERPAGACAPAPLERMNMDDFLRGGDGGAMDLEFDDACNAYIVTMISGPDHLRQLAPDGTLTTWTGVTNLNMGEVGVRRIAGDEFGTGDGEGQVALTYVCCAACGCVGADPQGVARLERPGPTTFLPMVIVAMPSQGEGPFQVPAFDTGPFGLTWGRDNRLYVGNVEAQGDLVEANLDAGSTRPVATLPARIHASATFGARTLLVAIEGGAIYRVGVDSGAFELWAELEQDVTSLVRDPFTGRVYVSESTSHILEYDARGTLLRVFGEPNESGRIAYAPDGYLYYVVPGYGTRAEVSRFELPQAL
jgi:hypothetical protein